jgi:hypothetical protein
MILFFFRISRRRLVSVMRAYYRRGLQTALCAHDVASFFGYRRRDGDGLTPIRRWDDDEATM